MIQNTDKILMGSLKTTKHEAIKSIHIYCFKLTTQTQNLANILFRARVLLFCFFFLFLEPIDDVLLPSSALSIGSGKRKTKKLCDIIFFSLLKFSRQPSDVDSLICVVNE